MKEKLQKHVVVSLTLISLALGAVCVTWFIHYNQRDIEFRVQSLLDAQQQYIAQLAEITDRNGADEITQAIVNDCVRRNEYDKMLGNLANLSKRELIVVQTLSESCSGFYAERKALMVSKMERELEHYNNLLTVLQSLNKHDVAMYHKEEWLEILTQEKARSTALRDLEHIQNEIITALISGASVQSAEVTEYVQSAQEISEMLLVYDKQADEVRARLAQ